MHSLSFFRPLLQLPSPSRGAFECFRLQHGQSPFDQFRLHGDNSALSIVSSSSSKPFYSLCTRMPIVSAAIPSSLGGVSAISLEDFHEKDWSFLESAGPDPEEHNRHIDRIIKAGEITEASRVLVSMSSEGFVDRLVESSPCQLLLAVHDSLFVLACIKEKHDKVKCWQGELIHLPEKWSPLDVVFLYFLPALPFKLEEVFRTLAKGCQPGARLVISHPQGREALELQREQSSDVIICDLPDKVTLSNVAENHSFEMAEFVDEPRLYLAVLKFSKR